MAKLSAHFNWNRNTTLFTDDYAGNGNVSEGMVNIAIGSGVVGNTAIFNGVDSTIKFGNILDAGGFDNVTCLFQIKKASSKLQMLSFKNKNVFVALNADDTVRFNLFIGAANTFLDSVGTIDTSSRTIECVYNGISMFIYIDGVLDNSKLQSGNIIASVDDFVLGHFDFGGDSLFFDGEMEAVDFRIDALIADQVSAWHDNPLGTEFIFQNEHNLALGDIVGGGKLFESLLPEIIGSVSFVVDDFTLRIKPIQNQFNLNDVPVRRANIFDEARQWLAEYNVVGDEPFFQIKDRVVKLGDSIPAFEGSKGIKLTKDASIFKNAIILGFDVEPPAEIETINNFAPIDLEFATTLYISGTTPLSWNGMLAPTPIRAQKICIINSGSFNITAKPENAGSLAPNRWNINGNLIMAPNQMRIGLYDVVRLRWRLT